MEAAGEAPLAHHETQRQHEESADSRHDVGDGHESGLVRLWDVVAAVLQVDAVERAFHGGCAEFIVHYKSERRIVSICEKRNIWITDTACYLEIYPEFPVIVSTYLLHFTP